MSVVQPSENEYQRVLRPRNNPPTLPKIYNYKLSDLPPYAQTAITEWGACLYAKSGEIKAKSWSGLVTFFSNHPELDWSWFQQVQKDWACCPQCGRLLPREARYWWVRNKAKGYFYMDACRDCKCSTDQRWSERKRERLDKSAKQ